jgi:hypothetical protein
MATSIDDLKTTMEAMATQLARIQDMAKQFAEFQNMMATTLNKLNDLEAWRTVAETSMGSMMQTSMEAATRLQQLEARPPPPPPPPPPSIPPPPHLHVPTRYDMGPHQPSVLHHPSAPPRYDTVPGAFDLNAMPALTASSSQSPHGHGLRNDYRVAGEGAPGFPPPHPVTGMIPTNSAPDFIPHDGDCSAIPHSSHGPKMEFPKFDGENPRLWRDQCVLFFEVYGTHPAMKTRFAILNFKGAAATWLQMVERRGRITDWSQLCELVFAKYDKDQYQQQLRQLEMLKQTGSVAEYHSQSRSLLTAFCCTTQHTMMSTSLPGSWQG